MTELLERENAVRPGKKPGSIWKNVWRVLQPIECSEGGRPVTLDPGDKFMTGPHASQSAALEDAARLMLVSSATGESLFGGNVEYLGPEEAP